MVIKLDELTGSLKSRRELMLHHSESHSSRKALYGAVRFGLFVVIVCGTILAGLNPREFAFDNKVEWLPDRHGIRFGEYAIAHSEPVLTAVQARRLTASGFTLEIALELTRRDTGGFEFIAAFHSGNDRSQLVIGQWRK